MYWAQPLLRGSVSMFAVSSARRWGCHSRPSIFFSRMVSTLPLEVGDGDIYFRKEDALIEVSEFLKGEPCHYSTLYEGSLAFLVGRERIGKSHLLLHAVNSVREDRDQDGKPLVPFVFNFDDFHGSYLQFLKSFQSQFKESLKRIPRKLTASEVLSIFIEDYSVSGAARLSHEYTSEFLANRETSFSADQLEDISRTLKGLKGLSQQDEDQLDPAVGCEALLRLVEALCSATGMTRHDASIHLALGAVAREESLAFLTAQIDPSDEAEGWLKVAAEGMRLHKVQTHGLCELALVMKYIEAVSGSCVIVRGIDNLASCDMPALGLLFSRMWIARYVSGRHKVPTIMESNNQSHVMEHYFRLGWVSNSESDFVPSIVGDIPVGYLPRFIEHGEWTLKEMRATLEPQGYTFDEIADLRSRVGMRVSDILEVMRMTDESRDLDVAVEKHLEKRRHKLEQRLNAMMSAALSKNAKCRLDLVRFLEAYLDARCSITYWGEGGEEFVSSAYTQELLERNILHMHIARPYITMSDEIVGVPGLRGWLKEQNEHIAIGEKMAHWIKSLVLGGYYFKHLNYAAGGDAPLH